MRKKNIIFGVIGFALAVVTGGQAFAALGPGEISMGVFSIPLPGCAPEVTISDEKDANDCYTMTIQNKTLQNGVCSSSGINPIPKKVCDGKDGAGGGDGIIDDVQGVYVPYPQSKGTCSGGTCQHPDRQGYLTTTVSFTDSARQPVVTISLDPCEVFYDETDDNKPKKKCTAQGDATSWPNSDNSDNSGNYEANESYIFEISDPATTLDSSVSPNPYLEYVEPTKNASGWFENSGHTVKVTVFVNGQQKREFYAVDKCDKYKNPSDLSAEAVVKCTVGEPGKTPGYTPGTTNYCLNINPSLCGNYVSLVDDGVCAGAGDDASRTVRSTTTEYYGPSGNSSSTSRNVGYVATTQVMCSNDSDDDITATHNDPCTPASNPTVTCAAGYTWQTCTNQTSTTQTYTGCFPSNLGQLFAYKDEIVPANFASDGNNLYYCQIQDCDTTSACWIDGNKSNGPNPSGKLDGTNCWGVVSIDGLQGDAGPGCSFAYYNNQWQVCCLPVDASGNVNVNGSWSCKEVTDTGILNQLNNWMCKPTYTTKYINKKGDGTYEYKSTTDNERTVATVGIRTTITNCDGTPGGDVDVFDGTDGSDYDPCATLPSSATDAQKKALIKKTTRSYTQPAGNGSVKTAVGFTTFTRETCLSGTSVTDKDEDICDPVMPADPNVCSNGVYYACSNPNYNDGDTYYYCDTSTNNLHNACANVSDADKPNTVKSVVSRVYTRTATSQGSMVSTYKMCDNSTHTESTADECKEVVPTPAGQTCTNGVWMQCKRQADEGTASATARGTTYGYCATYPQCVGNENSTTIVKKTERAYTAPTKTGTNSYYDTPGKMVTNKIPCSSSASAIVDSSEDDQCEEIPDTNSICPSDKKVLKTCKRKGDENTTDRKAETTYNLCTTGTSIFSAISDNDPCGGDTTSDAAKKKVKNIQYEYIAASGSGTVGYTKKITSMCNSSESPKEEYIYDTCISVSAAGGCNGANDKNYKCYNQTKLTSNNASEREYNVCNPSSNVSSVALADSVKAQSLFEIWKDQYKDKTETECQLLFGDNKKCGASNNNLTASDMLNSFTAYGVWKEDVVQKASDPNELTQDELSISAYQNSLKPCERFNISEDAGYDGSQGAGKRYTMTCVE